MTTTEEVLAVLWPGERVSYPALIERLKAAGYEVQGLHTALDDPLIIRRWSTGELYSWMHVYEAKERGPLYVERRVGALDTK